MTAHTVKRGFIAILFAVGVCSLVAVQPAVSGEGQETHNTTPPQPATNAAGEGYAAGSGILIHIDPQTGKILKQPAPGTTPLRLTPQLLNMLSTSGQGLVVVPSGVPGGGIRIDLQGRFMSPLFATIGPDGEQRIRHLHEIPAADDENNMPEGREGTVR